MQHNISVIIPVWNAEPYLRRCLDSVVNQTLRNIEIICVNDASTDNSLAILQEYAANDNRMRVVTLEKNSGESVARNTALALVQGEYMGSVDNDDAIDLDFYEKLYTKAKETDADIVKGDTISFDYNLVPTRHMDSDKILDDKFNFSHCWWSAIYKKKLLIENKIEFPEELVLGGDLVFLTKAICFANNVQVISNTFYNYFRRKDSGDSLVVNLKKAQSFICHNKLIIEFINSLDSKTLNEEQYMNIFIYKFLNSQALINKEFSFDILFAANMLGKSLLYLYNNCKYKNIFEMKFSNIKPELLKILKTKNEDALLDYLLLYSKNKAYKANYLRRKMASRV